MTKILTGLIDDLKQIKGDIYLSKVEVDKMKPYEMLMDSEAELRQLKSIHVKYIHREMGPCGFCEQGHYQAGGIEEPVFKLEGDTLKEITYEHFSPGWGVCSMCGAI